MLAQVLIECLRDNSSNHDWPADPDAEDGLLCSGRQSTLLSAVNVWVLPFCMQHWLLVAELLEQLRQCGSLGMLWAGRWTGTNLNARMNAFVRDAKVEHAGNKWQTC